MVTMATIWLQWQLYNYNGNCGYYGYNGIKNYIHGLKSYVSSKSTCFFWLIIRLMAEYNIM